MRVSISRLRSVSWQRSEAIKGTKAKNLLVKKFNTCVVKRKNTWGPYKPKVSISTGMHGGPCLDVYDFSIFLLQPKIENVCYRYLFTNNIVYFAQKQWISKANYEVPDSSKNIIVCFRDLLTFKSAILSLSYSNLKLREWRDTSAIYVATFILLLLQQVMRNIMRRLYGISRTATDIDRTLPHWSLKV